MSASVQEFTVHPKEFVWESPACGGFQWNLVAEHEWRGCKRSKWHEVGKSNKSYLRLTFPANQVEEAGKYTTARSWYWSLLSEAPP